MTSLERRLLRSLSFYALLLLGLHVLVQQMPVSWAGFWYPAQFIGPKGQLSPREWLWGVIPYTYLARWLQIMLALVGAGITTRLAFNKQPRIPDLRYPTRKLWRILLAALSLIVFWSGRVMHMRWGDAYLLIKGMAHPDVRLTYSWQAPLDTYLHAQLFHLGERWWGWQDALPAYWILSSLAGALAVWVLLRLADAIGRTDLERWIILGVLVTLGTVQLFFGYPETYTIISLLILIFLWTGWRFVQGIDSLWKVSVTLALAQSFHPATLALQPALWYLAWWGWRRRNQPVSQLLLQILAPHLVIGAGVLGLMTAGGHGLSAFLGPESPGGGDHRWWVPLFQTTTEWEHYTMFSRGHLMDILNEQLLTAPFTLPMLGLLVIFIYKKLPRDAYATFLMLAAAFYLLLTFTWNADYGGQRDWDVFSPAAWPATLLMSYWLTRALSAPALLRTGLIVIINQTIYTVAWIYSNTRPWEWPS